LVILGLAVATCEHHGAALVIDGQVVSAVEEERLNREKHYGWSPPGRPGANLCNDPALTLNDVMCKESVRRLLDDQGLSLADVDHIAVNGIPHRHHGARECVTDGRYVFVPHHLSHAALAARTSPWRSCNVLTVDGRGEYETAAFFTYREGELTRRAELPAGEGRSLGGAYETVTRVIGFGPHGQGQTMALAAFGQPSSLRLSSGISVQSFDDYTLDERRLQVLAHERVGPEPETHGVACRDLAADIQRALEDALVALGRDGQERSPSSQWAIAGGVALNCRANSVLRDALGVELWVPSAAHDAGTALGAALEAAHLLGEPPCNPLRTAGLGPDIDDEHARQTLAEHGLTPAKGDAIALAAERLNAGRVIGWAVGRLEYGPRALGFRSITAHPGHPGVQDRVNAIKDRQSWRPFGPSVLEEHASAWFVDSDFGPFMTFTADVIPHQRERVSGVVHEDGSTRPQAVDRTTNLPWRSLIEAFHERSGVPMVLNTSFNGRDEAIVATAEQAVQSALRLGLDGLVLGRWYVDLPAVER
jgi:predicted NodU family carbamoyl transferase